MTIIAWPTGGCPNCGWVQTVKPQEDAVRWGDYREHADWDFGERQGNQIRVFGSGLAQTFQLCAPKAQEKSLDSQTQWVRANQRESAARTPPPQPRRPLSLP